MPKALERALKRKVAGKKWSEERKDAYVYGTLRKTGWKPSHQKKMSDESNTISFATSAEALKAYRQAKRIAIKGRRYAPPIAAGAGGLLAGRYLFPKQRNQEMNSKDKVIRLAAINQRLDAIINFQDDDDYADDDERRRALLGKAAIGAGALGAGGLGYTYAKGVQALGGFKQGVGKTLQAGYGAVKPQLAAAGQAIKSGAQTAYGASKGAIMNVLKRFRFNAETGLIEFSGNPKDPGAGMFGGNDPGILARLQKGNAQVSALQRLRMKIATLRAMGLNK